MAQWRTVLIIMFIVLTCFVQITMAKCPVEIYTITGVVLDNTNTPINGASITVFFNDQESGFTGYSSGKGEFVVKGLYDTFKRSSLFGDVCEDNPSSLTVVVHSNGYFSKKLNVKLSRTQKMGESNILGLPPVILVRILPGTEELLK
jgi:hypothetical protein